MTASATSDLQQFTAGVQRTLAALQRLEAALTEEQAALAGTSPDALEQAVQAKLAVLNELEPVLAERDAVQKRLGAQAGIAGGDHLLARAPADAPVRRQWDQVKDLAKRIEQLNVQNGQLALQGEKTARHAVAILTGRQAEPQVYGRRGSTDKRLGGFTLGEA